MAIKAVLFDIDGTLLITDGAGAGAWTLAFKELFDVDADISKYTDNGMTDPEVGRLTFEAVLHREPSADEFSALMASRTQFLAETVTESAGYRVLPGVVDLLTRLQSQHYPLGLVTGNTDEAARLKLHRGHLEDYFSFGGYGSGSDVGAGNAALPPERSGGRGGEALVVR